MQTIEFKGKNWLIGLDWEQLPGDESLRQEAKEAAEKKNSSYGILVDYDQQSAIGLAKKDSKVPSAALYLAVANQEARAELSNLDNYPDWILVDEVGDDKYWMSVIRDGIPSPSYDIVLDITSVKEHIVDLLNNDTYRLFSPCGEIKSIFEGVKETEDRDLNTLTENVKPKNKFIKLRGIPNSFIIAGLVLIVVVGAGIGLSNFIQGRSLKEKALAFKRQQEAEQRRQEDVYQKQLQDYNQGRAFARQAAVQSIILGLAGKPSPYLSQWYDTVGNIQTGTHGWTLTTGECSLSLEIPTDPNKCVITFKRTGLSTNRMFLQDYPNAVISGDSAAVTIPLPIAASTLNHYGNAQIEQLPNSKNWGFDMISQLQLLKIANINHEIKSSQEIIYTEPAKPLTPKQITSGVKPNAPQKVSLNVAKGDVYVTSNNFDLIREVAENVDFYAVGIKKVDFKFGELGDIQWSIDLNYFVRSGTGAITGSNSSFLSNSSVPENTNGPTNVPKDANGQALPGFGTNGAPAQN